MTKATRRDFLRGSSTAAAALAFAHHQPVGWWDEVRVAVVGLRGRGDDHLQAYRGIPGVRVVALVDVDQQVLARAAKRCADAGLVVDTYADLRTVLERKDVDAVSIATPNHWHALQAIWSCQAGKHVYVEKPVSHNVFEGAQLVAAARKYGRIVQAGMQCRSSHGIAAGIAWVQAGNLGAIQYARGLCYKPRPSIGKVSAAPAVPAHVDFDLWCGPAPKVPPRRAQLHYDWHWDFATGNGDLGNQGIHQMDIARWALGEAGLPQRTISVGGRVGYDDDGETPNTHVVWHQYERGGLLFEVRGLPRDRAAQTGDWGKGMDQFLGTRIGVVVHCAGGTLRIPDYTRAIAYDADGKELRRFEGASDHFANFIGAVRSQRDADLRAPIHEGHVSSALCHLGNVSHRVGERRERSVIEGALAASPHAADAAQRMFQHLADNGVAAPQLVLGGALQIDAAAAKIVDHAAAEKLLTRDYRAGFAVPAEV